MLQIAFLRLVVYIINIIPRYKKHMNIFEISKLLVYVFNIFCVICKTIQEESEAF